MKAMAIIGIVLFSLCILGISAGSSDRDMDYLPGGDLLAHCLVLLWRSPVW
jgi:hypothetical protein